MESDILYRAMVNDSGDKVLINLKLDPWEREEFRLACKLRGASMSGLLHQYIVQTIRAYPPLFSTLPRFPKKSAQSLKIILDFFFTTGYKGGVKKKARFHVEPPGQSSMTKILKKRGPRKTGYRTWEGMKHRCLNPR